MSRTFAPLTCIALMLCTFLSGGCLIREVRHTWYLDPSGAVTWTLMEKDVRSDANAADDRAREEGEYWLAVQQDRHDMPAGLRELGATRVRATVLRREAPFLVHTEGRFDRIDQLGERLIAALGASGQSRLVQHDGGVEWHLVVRDPSAPGMLSETSPGVGALVGDLDRLDIVLTSGRFVQAAGFELSADRRVASFKRTGEPDGSDERYVALTLAWTPR